MNDFTGRQLIHKILMQAWDFMNLPGHVNYERKKKRCDEISPQRHLISSATRIRTWKMLESESSALPFGDSASQQQ